MRILVIAAALLTLVGAGCAAKTPIKATPNLPAATGETKVTRDPNGNSVVRLKVEHFAPPQNLQPPKSVYVVWIETPQGQYLNAGQLRIDENRSGMVTVTTPYKNFRMAISAEDFATVSRPTQVVLRTDMLEAK